MVKTSLNRVIPALALTHLLGFALFFLAALILKPISVLKSLEISYAFQNAFLSYIEFIIPLNCTAIILAFSLFFSIDDFISPQGSAYPFYKAVTPVLILLLVITLIYTVLIVWVQPGLYQSITRMETRTRLAKTYMTLAEDEENAERYREALNYIQLVLDIEPENARALEAKDVVENIVHSRGLLAPFQEDKTIETPGVLPDKTDAYVDELVAKARDFLDQQDYFSAYYHILEAYDVAPGRIDVTGLFQEVTRIMDRITKSLEHDITEEKTFLSERELFQRKMQGVSALVRGDYINSYFILKDLEDRLPEDPDIPVYLAKAYNNVQSSNFFIEDILSPLSLPGVEDIFFLNINNNATKELVYIEKMVGYKGDYLFKNVEVMRLNRENQVELHYTAPYGKYWYADVSEAGRTQEGKTQNNINFRCISKESRKEEHFPVIHTKEIKILDNVLPLHFDLNYMASLNLGTGKYKKMNINELFLIRNMVEKSGYNPREVDMEVLYRILLPFLFFSLSILSIALGWAYRSRHSKRPPVITILLIPLFPLVISVMVKLFIFINRLFFSFLVLSSGFTLTMVAGIVLQFINIALAILIVSSQITE